MTGSGLVEGFMTVLDTFTAQDMIVNGVSTFFAQTVFKDKVRFDKHPTFPTDSGGDVFIKKGKDSVKVVFNKPYDAVPAISATLSIDNPSLEAQILDADYSYAVVKKTADGFSIKLNKLAQDDLKFSWTAIQTQ